MNIKAYLDGVETPINTGFTIRQTITEELDTAMVILPWKEGSLQLHQFDDFKITIDDKSFTFVVGDYQTELANKELDLYNYQVSLISETIKLQKIPLPNLSITQSLNYKKTIVVYVQRYFQMYVKNKYPELKVDPQLNLSTAHVPCPEYQWNEPTAYEVYNDLLAPIDSLVRVNNHTISPIKITDKGNPIDESKIFFTNKAKAINDNINEIHVEAQNPSPASVNVCSPHGITPRNIDQAGITTDDLKIHLDKPIDKITYAEMTVKVKRAVTQEKITITIPLVNNVINLIPEVTVYNTKKVSNSIEFIGSEFKRGNFYYTQGGNDIEGLSYNENNLFNIGKSLTAIENIIYYYLYNNVPDGKDYEINQDLRDIGFYIEYTTLDNAKFVVKKESKHYAGITDHQSESYVDANQFGSAEEMTLKRLGNEVKEINAQYKNIADVPSLGDYIGDYILITRELNIYNDYILFKGTLSKDYVNRDLFYGVNAKKRNTQISLGNDALLRTDVVNYKCKFSFTFKFSDYITMGQYLLHGINLSNAATDPTLYAKLDTLNIKGVTMFTEGSNDEAVGPNVFLTPATYKFGKQVVVTFRAYDNFSVGMYISDVFQKGGYGQQYARYVDDNGEFKTLSYRLHESLRPYYPSHPEYDGSITPEQALEVSRGLPRNNTPYLTEKSRHALEDSIMLYKDNREITALSLQFTYENNEDEGIYIYDEMINHSPLIDYENKLTECDVYLNIDSNKKYSKFSKEPIGFISSTVRIDFTDYKKWIESGRTRANVYNRIKLALNGESIDVVLSWGIATKDGKLLIGVNKRPTDTTIADTIYLNVSKDNI